MTEAAIRSDDAAPVPGDAAERARVGKFGAAILVRAVIGTALWIAVHRNAAVTAALVATCWWPAWLVHRARGVLATDRERARQHLGNAGLVVLLATAAWTLWGLVLAGKGKEVAGWALTLLWSFLFLCFVVDFVLFRWGLRAVPDRSGDDTPLTADRALRPGDLDAA